VKKVPPAILLLAGLIFAECGSYRLEKRLEPESRDFLSKVRYLISNKERNEFVRLAAAERPGFIEAFWSARDPNPNTPENEFKVQYFRRIAEANRLFNEGGGAEAGWLQDRGRMYVLLGPPSDRLAYPRGVTFYGKPTEIWYYGFFPIVFVDEAWNGNYKLDPTSAVQLAEIMKTQMAWKPEGVTEKGILAFDIDVEKQDQNRVLVRLKVPYPKIWMKATDGGFGTTLAVTLKVQDSTGRTVHGIAKDYPIALTQKQLETLKAEDYIIEIPLELQSGSFTMIVSMTNTADSSRADGKREISH